MSSCCGEQVVPPTQKSAKYVLVLKIIMLIQFIIIILNFVALEEFLRQAIIGLIFLIFLFVAYYKLSYHAMMMYVFMSIYFSIMFLIYILTPAQKQQDLSKRTSMETYYYVVACISFIFYSFCSIFCFFPYREFKAIEFSQNPAIAEIIGGGGDRKDSQQKLQKWGVQYGKKDYQDQKKKQSYDVFKGQGVRIG